MPLKKMSLNEELGDSAAHFFKSGNIIRADGYQELTDLRRVLPKNLKVEYDLWYDMDDDKRVHGYVYTDFMNMFLYVRPADTKRTYEVALNAAEAPITEEGEYLFSKIAENKDKYALPKSHKKHDFVVFMAGTNIWSKITSAEKLDNAIEQGAYLKPHPLTAAPMLGHLKSRFPADRILKPKTSGYELLEQADIVGCFTNSEMGLSALARGKSPFLFNETDKQYTFSAIYNAISVDGRPQKDKFLSLLSSKESGLIPLHAKNPQEYSDGFFDLFAGQNKDD